MGPTQPANNATTNYPYINIFSYYVRPIKRSVRWKAPKPNPHPVLDKPVRPVSLDTSRKQFQSNIGCISRR